MMAFLLADPGAEDGKRIEDVALLGREAHIQEIRKNGLKVALASETKTIRFENCFSCLDELAGSNLNFDLVIFCVKTHSLARASEEIEKTGILNRNLKDAAFVLLMNGMGNADMLSLPRDRVFEGVTSFGVRFAKDGLVELKGMGQTVFEDALDLKTKDFLRERFERENFEIKFVSDFKKHQWNKLFINSVINPITALTGKRNGIVLSEHLKETVERIIDECAKVAAAEGIDANSESIKSSVYSVAAKTRQNTSSMLQDAQKGKATEIDSINGYVIRLAKKRGIPVPINEILYSLVKSMEAPDASEV
ncbi:MAG: 2-dehydropantoate 2-reductase [Methanothrix sp.]|nr:MAG: 2-dehydropantoate 2-reductase [Methanothrix sp.]